MPTKWKNNMKTKEPQYQCTVEFKKKYGLQKLGLMSSHTWIIDPKRLVFVLSRYKFVAKMFENMDSVLEVGCADAFGTKIVQQAVKKMVAVDFDSVFIDDAKKRNIDPEKIEYRVHNILEAPVLVSADGVFSLDVLEHIPEENETEFIKNLIGSSHEHGTIIIGTPSLQSQIYASEASKEGHINCKDHIQLKSLLSKFFYNVFLFSMNDEVIHTGFYPMANYLIALCCSPIASAL
jgi:2-polyprenyl-3-methyl-5-hydroxy-6-metoxy-1,4-benzoquinol methylase